MEFNIEKKKGYPKEFKVIKLLFQNSISTCQIHTDWTKAKVCLVFKKASKGGPAHLLNMHTMHVDGI